MMEVNWTGLLPWTIGMISIAYWSLNIYQANKDTENWPRVSGKILDSKIQFDRGGVPAKNNISANTIPASTSNFAQRPGHQLHATYQYQVNDQRFTSNRLAFVPIRSLFFSNNNHPLTTLLQKIPIGSEVDVFYNPKNPQEAVIFKQSSSDLALYREPLLVSYLLAIVGLGLFFLINNIKLRDQQGEFFFLFRTEYLFSIAVMAIAVIPPVYFTFPSHPVGSIIGLVLGSLVSFVIFLALRGQAQEWLAMKNLLEQRGYRKLDTVPNKILDHKETYLNFRLLKNICGLFHEQAGVQPCDIA